MRSKGKITRIACAFIVKSARNNITPVKCFSLNIRARIETYAEHWICGTCSSRITQKQNAE